MSVFFKNIGFFKSISKLEFNRVTCVCWEVIASNIPVLAALRLDFQLMKVGSVYYGIVI